MIGHPCPAPEPQWWASFDGGETYSIGPCDTREDAIAEALDDGSGEYEAEPGVWRQAFTVALCRRNHVDLSRRFDADEWLERLAEGMDDEDGPDANGNNPPLEEITTALARDLEASVQSAIWHWQNRKGLSLAAWWFADCWHQEELDMPCDPPAYRSSAG